MKLKHGRRGLTLKSSSWVHVDDSAVESFGEMCLEIVKLVDDALDDSSTSLKVAAISAMEVSVYKFPSYYLIFSMCLSSVTIHIQSDNVAFSSSCIRRTGALINVLGPRALPELPSINVMSRSRIVSSSVSAITNYGEDPKLKLKADVVQKLITEKITVRLLLPPLLSLYSEAIAYTLKLLNLFLLENCLGNIHIVNAIGSKQQDHTLEEEFKYLTSIHISLAGADDMDTRVGNEIAGREYSDFVTSEEYVSARLCNVLDNNDSPDLSQFEVEKTRWIIDDERMGEASVEEIIGSNILPIFQGDNYKFHAAGREDIDVRMLGSGRPFLIEVQNARHVPSEMSVKEIERKINSMENNLVKVKNVKVVGSQGWSLIREGEAEKQNQYAALVWISHSLEDDDLKTLASFMDMPILQRTPIRVLHCRSPLEREKIIHWMKVEKIAGSSQYFLLHLCTQPIPSSSLTFGYFDWGQEANPFGSVFIFSSTSLEVLLLLGGVTGVATDAAFSGQLILLLERFPHGPAFSLCIIIANKLNALAFLIWICHSLSLLLEELDLKAAALHSLKTRSLRLAALHRFKSGQIPVLLATDVASCGLD
ncbi:hypothetical protein RHGRI_007462 [Rhododendron griersonianum]|nr:hypothetical protein RHGRI_007462 [Rhododendron griersonianum]